MGNIYFQEAFEKYNKRITHPELNTTPDEIQEFSDRLRNGENLTIMRFNDGEWGFALDIKRWTELKVKENHPDAEVQLKYSGILLKEVLDSEPDYYVSIDSFTLTDDIFKKDIEPHLEKFQNRLKGGFFNVWSLSTGFKDLFEILKTRKVLLVGPEFLSKLPFHKDHITTDPKRGIYNVQKYVYDVIRYLDKHYKPNMVIVYSCSFIAKVAIDEIYKIYGNSITQLDVGAALNPFVGVSNRPWHDLIITELKNIKI
jgi:hypothetical protein